MYSEWVSLTESIQTGKVPDNVLQTFPTQVGKDVVLSVLKPLAELVSKKSDVVSPLITSGQVQWTMQVVGYGFTLSLMEQNLILSCIEVYDSWLSALYSPKRSVPVPIVKDPDHYVHVIFEQFCDLFIPRPRTAEATLLEAHVFLCRKVLQITEGILKKKDVKLSRETWNALFKYLLKVSDILLSPPTEPFSLGLFLCERLIHVLFEAWLKACINCFPAPNLWKSLRELCCNWRHHRSVVEQWNKLMYSLTVHVISLLYTPKYLSSLTSLPDEDVDFRLILTDLSNDALVQCWFRMLHTLGNPVELSYPNKFVSLPTFQKAIAVQGKCPTCLNDLPTIFFEAMKGVATLVYLFMGHELPPRNKKVQSDSSAGSTPVPPRHSPITRRRDSKEGREGRTGQLAPAVSTSKLKPTTKWYIQAPSLPATDTKPPSPLFPGLVAGLTGEVGKPKGNTLLHLFGSWLFEAAVWPLHAETMEPKRGSHASSTTALTSIIDLTHATDPSHAHHEQMKPSDYEAGRAEAFGALCSIFSSQPCGEPFLPIYLARFYHALAVGLQYDEELCQGQVLTRIILNSADLLRKDLQGINILVPKFLAALELILPWRRLPFKCPVNTKELRRASVRLLLSMSSLPLHFLHQPLPDLQNIVPEMVSSSEGGLRELDSSLTFYSLRDRILQLFFSAIQHETDATNIQMLLHGLMAMIRDIVTYENAVAKMVEEEMSEGDVEVSAILSQHQPLAAMRSDQSSHSQLRNPATNMDKDLSSAGLLARAIEAAYKSLTDWESSVQVSLAALELMAGLAQLQFENLNHADCKQAVRWVCEYIKHQAQKDQPLHSRDLHTSIVAAFTTLLTWIMSHPYLLGNKVCLTSIMKVSELGISGSFSNAEDGIPGSVIYKGEKELKPISGRVKEVAEFVLNCVMEKIGSFPSPCGAEATSSLLAEDDLLARLTPARKEKAHFRYFVMDNSLILGMLEEPFTEEKEALPTVTAILRGPTGRHVWTLQLRHQPRSEEAPVHHLHSMPRPAPNPLTPTLPSLQAPVHHLHSMPRPAPNPLTPTLPSLKRKPWPEEVNWEPETKVNKSIPSLQDTLVDSTRSEHAKMTELTKEQMEAEESVHHDSLTQLPYPHPNTALEPPGTRERFETARLLLSHLGLLGIESIKYHPPPQFSALATLDSSCGNFKNNLTALDRLPTRFCNTVFVLYVREGLTKPEDILAYQHSLSNKPAEFIEFLHGLGWIVDPVNHPGFLGKIRPSKTEDASHAVGIQAEKPLRPFPYYADAMSEVAFITPMLKPSASDSAASLRSVGSSDSGQDLTSYQAQGDPTPSLPSHYSMQTLREPQGSGVSESTVQAESENKYTTFPVRKQRTVSASKTEATGSDTPRRRLPVPQDCAAMVVWLEKFEDHTKFPLETMSNILHGSSFFGFGSHKPSKKGLPTIFIHMLSSGLYQTTTKSPSSRQDLFAGPLIDGMVVSRRTLSTLVRQTAVNMCTRHRMENEGYSPPHVKRKRKVEEIATGFAKRITVADFYNELFVEQGAQYK